MAARIITGDCVERMRELPDGSIDAVCTDPPYGLEFMGKDWDRLGATVETAAEGADRSHPFRDGSQRVRYGKSAASMQAWHECWAREALRVLKPGGHLLAFGGTRTYHRLTAGLEDAGFEIRDCVMYCYGSGFPKSLDVSKAIDKAAGAEREVVGSQPDRWTGAGGVLNFATDRPQDEVPVTAGPATPAAERWQGWGTALKPAWEPIVVARKPLAGTVAGNVLAHGTGALNVDGCRIETGETWEGRELPDAASGVALAGSVTGELNSSSSSSHALGRWPANVVLAHSEDCVRVGKRQIRADGHFPSSRGASGYGSAEPESNGGGLRGQDELAERHFDGEAVALWACVPGCPVRALDDQAGSLPGGTPRRAEHGRTGTGATFVSGGEHAGFGDQGGGPSRFFYCAKTSRAERGAGLADFEPQFAPTMGNGIGGKEHDPATATPKANVHPTVKPIDLMRWLVRLVTPPGGRILDPFCGSGSTGCAAVLEGFEFVGIEREADYVAIAEARIRFWAEHPTGLPAEQALVADGRRRKVRESGQLGLL